MGETESRNFIEMAIDNIYDCYVWDNHMEAELERLKR